MKPSRSPLSRLPLVGGASSARTMISESFPQHVHDINTRQPPAQGFHIESIYIGEAAVAHWSSVAASFPHGRRYTLKD